MFAAVTVMSGIIAWSAVAEEGKAQTSCPVMKGAVNKEMYVDHDGKRIYVCCGACIPEVKKNPEKYIKQLEDEGVVLEKVPADAGAKE
ncbi:MAG TPA: hypothetical protein DCZ95_10345 [Verrucomicrobia bacterium]|nr:hypothetical protein [Verrucomicrobiota bacterium]